MNSELQRESVCVLALERKKNYVTSTDKQTGTVTVIVALSSLLKKSKNIFNYEITTYGSGVLNPRAMFLRFVTVAFLLFLAPAEGPKPAGQSLTLN